MDSQCSTVACAVVLSPAESRRSNAITCLRHYAQATAESSEQELACLTSAVASINVWNRLGVAYRWTPPAREKTPQAAAS